MTLEPTGAARSRRFVMDEFFSAARFVWIAPGRNDCRLSPLRAKAARPLFQRVRFSTVGYDKRAERRLRCAGAEICESS
ncbi:MAG: hypothetical protein ACI8P0_002495 [Planctomycetaceae bacterium]